VGQILKGRLLKWDSGRGFGFIQPENNSENIFIHISDFKDKSYRPIIGEIFIYEIGRGKEGKKKAIYVYPEKQLKHARNRKMKKNFAKKRFFPGKIKLLILLGAIGISGVFFQKNRISKTPIVHSKQEIHTSTEDEESIEEFLKRENKFIEKHTNKSIAHSSFKKERDKYIEEFLKRKNKFIEKHVKKKIVDLSTEKDKGKCDGRQYCSQMNSCDEAKYFLAHCPNPRMDGDGDGIPCEGQWCGH